MQDEWLEDCLDQTAGMTRIPSPSHTDELKENKNAKPHSTPLTLKWLEENYENAEGVCIPRNALYVHYLDYCERNSCQPVNAASFGKIIRQQFPHITTRRLGTRGQSKYHYYGIGVKESSVYYEISYSKKGIQGTLDGHKEPLKQMSSYTPRSKLGTLLPEFPRVEELSVPGGVTEEATATFLVMYRTHCQRVLDTVIRASFDEVQAFLLHFWQGMPQHMVPVLGTPFIVSLVGVCDSILYKTITTVLMPTVLQALPDSLTQVIRKFARQFDDWLRTAMENLPPLLQQMKFDLARRFSQVLKRQTSLNHLCQATRTVMQSGDIICQMLDDWSHVDLSSIVKQTLYTMDQYHDTDYQLIVSLYREFEGLLQEQAPIEAFAEWLEAMVDRCVVKPARRSSGGVRRRSRQFLLMWSCFGTRVIRDMTLHSAPSFGSFHLLHLMFDDYVLYLVESLHSQERTRELLATIKGERSPGDLSDDSLPSLHQVGLSSVVGAERPVDRRSVITDARDAYTSPAMYTSSPPSSAARSQDSSVSPSYDVTGRSQVSPADGPHDNSPGSHVINTAGRLESGHYSADYNTSSTHTDYPGHYDVTAAQSQCQFSSGRDYRYTRPECTDQRYQSPTAASSNIQCANYTSYNPATRDSSYDVTSYHYEAPVYAGTPRSSHTMSGSVYYYGPDHSLQTYTACANFEPGAKKQKVLDTSVEEYSKKIHRPDFVFPVGSSH